jgi:heme/copper-type cytochrome/quinol oxidase subunit 3
MSATPRLVEAMAHAATEPPTRPVADVAHLPDSAFGHRDLMWWGTVGFMVIEGFTLALCAVVYVYLGKNFDSWPPLGTPNPSLGVPTLHVALMLLSLPVVRWVSHAARDFQLGKVRIGLTVLSLICALFVGLRAVELLDSLNVKWSTNAYGSAQWLVVGSHATLILIELVEVAGVALMFWIAPIEEKHFSDADDVAFYWYFMVLAWLPLYVLCFLGPRWV